MCVSCILHVTAQVFLDVETLKKRQNLVSLNSLGCFRYFDEVFNASGGPDLVKKYGSWFSFSDNPRAQIFRRNQSLVTDMESMVRLMRYKPAQTSNHV